MAATAVPLRDVLAVSGVRRLLGSSLVARLPMAAVGLLVLLRTRELGGSYALGGLATGALAAAMATAAPALGRLVDRRGQRAVLVPSAIVASAALCGLALLPGGTPGAAIVALAAVAGLSHPPLSACARALWPRLLPDARRRHAAFALESALLEVTYLAGPLVLVGALATRSAALALGVSAAILLAGTAVFASHPATRAPGSARAAGTPRGVALRVPAVRTVLAVQAALGCSFAALEVAVTAFAADHGAPSATGPLLAAWGAGSLAGGLVAARSGAPRDPAGRLAALLAAMAVADAALLAAGGLGLLALGAGLLVAGAAIAPAFALVGGILGDAAPAGAVTESQAWLSTGIAVGLAAGSALAGALVDGGGPLGAFALAALGATVAAVVTAARAATLAPPAATPVAATTP
ncbi:MAG TPA: MFS transporter, partial [Solirubrobacteraceae bacterium]|nr:MFS transporter [Solirubrobacteraceae bacterium]